MYTSINHNLMAANTARTLNAHYSRLATSTQRLSSGLRVNSAADDAAGLAIRELQRADIASLHQGARNANDAISMIQVADGALGIIDEKLIRMKELAEQAATGTYSSTQRLMIHSEFQAMASEIDRIANATDFNGVKLLDGSLSGAHDGKGLTSTGKMKIHFGTANDSAEDYYYIEIGDCTVKGLGLGGDTDGKITWSYGQWASTDVMGTIKNTGDPSLAVLGSPASNKNYHIISMQTGGLGEPAYTNAAGGNYQTDQPKLDTLQWQVFSKDGTHYAGTKETAADSLWSKVLAKQGYASIQDWMDRSGLFAAGAQYALPGNNIPFAEPGNQNDGVRYEKTGICNALYFDDISNLTDKNGQPLADDDLILVALTMPNPGEVRGPDGEPIDIGGYPSIDTQEKAQKMLTRINDAIVSKDKIRAHLGAMQNRLENTVANLNIQAENLQAAESRISDVDVATEMTEFVRNQILTQSATAMLGQANSLPQMMMQLIGG